MVYAHRERAARALMLFSAVDKLFTVMMLCSFVSGSVKARYRAEESYSGGDEGLSDICTFFPE